ncbi:GNAT family N-acetyltransferase [Kribbella sp. CA-245084]|uniref:GNAT family N-acetyltransferase n=1 Tax=Kribbella sp. CA-245084 TaxID=3239940 RepID=UPI003D8A0EC9
MILTRHRRQGIAKLLLNQCSDATVALRVQDDNAPALALYRSAGFRSVAGSN